MSTIDLTPTQIIDSLQSTVKSQEAKIAELEAQLAQIRTDLTKEIPTPWGQPAPWGAAETPISDYMAGQAKVAAATAPRVVPEWRQKEIDDAKARMELAKAAAAAKYGDSRLRAGNSW